MTAIDTLSRRVAAYNVGDPKRIQHTLKVHALARMIGLGEGLRPGDQQILEVAALVHDVGIRAAESALGYSNGKLQEELGPAVAEAMLRELGFNEGLCQRACFLVSRHHTYDEVDGMDYRILLEADFLVNLYEDEAGMDAILEAEQKIFRTATGTALLREMFGLT